MQTTKAQPQSFWQARSIAVGVGLAALSIGFASLLPHAWALEFFAALLALIGAIYVGMAIEQGRQLIFQFAVAIGFMLLGLLGLWLSPWWLVAGYFAHGVWDWLHHNHKQPLSLTQWYAPFCLVVDWLIGSAIVIWWI